MGARPPRPRRPPWRTARFRGRLRGPAAAHGPTLADRLSRRQSGGQAHRHLAIVYPSRLRENEDAEISAAYTAEDEWRSSFADSAGPRPALKLTVDLAASRLALTPQPARYTFDNARILAGGDSRSWILSPEREGTYTLLARLEVEPAGFRAVPVRANSEALGPLGAVPLQVPVHTRYSVPQATVDLARAAASLLAFLLSLPFAASLAKRWLDRGAAPAAPAAPTAPPDEGPSRAPRRSGKRRPG